MKSKNCILNPKDDGINKEVEMKSNCEYCANYSYDDEYECYVCEVNLDEDEMARFITGNFRECPYFQMGDEYRIVRKQM